MSLVLVAGPPLAGKTTFVKVQVRDGEEPVLDWDEVFSELSGLPVHDRRHLDRARLESLTEQTFRQRLEEIGTQGQGWIIRTAPKAQHRAIVRRIYGATSVVLAIPEEECLRRLAASDRPHPEEDARAIARWWQRYEPSSSPEERVVVDMTERSEVGTREQPPLGASRPLRTVSGGG